MDYPDYTDSDNNNYFINVKEATIWGADSLNVEPLPNNELIDRINSLSPADKVGLIERCGGSKRAKKMFRKLYYYPPIKALEWELKKQDSSLIKYLELSCRAGLDPLPALRARGIKVKFVGEYIGVWTVNQNFENEDLKVAYNFMGGVQIATNPWNRETETNLINKGLKFRLSQAADKKRNRETRLKNRTIRKKIIKYSSED